MINVLPNGEDINLRQTDFLFFSLAAVYIVLGSQKLVPGASPVGPDVGSFVSSLGFSISSMKTAYFIGFYEMVLGLLFYFRKLQYATVMFLPHQLLTFTVFFITPNIVFSPPYLHVAGFEVPYLFDYFGAFIFKNIIFLGAFSALFIQEKNSKHQIRNKGRIYQVFGLFLIIFTFSLGSFAIQNPDGSHLSDYKSNDNVGQEAPNPKFTDVTDKLGLNYTLTEPPERRLQYGGGVYVSDTNNNGRKEILLTGGEKPKLYGFNESFQELNVIPDLGSKDIIAAHFFDFDADGYEDLILLPYKGQPILLENEPKTISRPDEYRRKFRPAGRMNLDLKSPLGAVSADFNNDSCIDILIYQSSDEALRDGTENYLMENKDCGVEFQKAKVFKNSYEGVNPLVRGVKGSKSVTQAATFYDFTGNRLPDIHFANDFRRDIVYKNEGEGSFQSHIINDHPTESMSSRIADITGNREPDIFVTDINSNNLITSISGEYKNRAVEYGFYNSKWGWGVLLEDFNNDGRIDIVHENSERWSPSKPSMWIKSGDRYQEVYKTGIKQLSGAGLVSLDLDNDGDLDIIQTPRYLKEGEYLNNRVKNTKITDLTNNHNRIRVYENNLTSNNYISLSIVTEQGSPALGSQATIYYGNSSKTKFLTSGSGYMSQNPRILHFGLGESKEVDKIEVDWSNGEDKVLSSIEANQSYKIKKSTPSKVKN